VGGETAAVLSLSEHTKKQNHLEVWGGQRERDRETETEREIETERDRERERGR